MFIFTVKFFEYVTKTPVPARCLRFNLSGLFRFYKKPKNQLQRYGHLSHYGVYECLDGCDQT